MLVLTRKLTERLYIGDGICVTVLRVGGGQVRLGIEAPSEVPIVRGELRERDRTRRPPTAGVIQGTPWGTVQVEAVEVSRNR
jgi:carbon storage regulator